MPRWTEQDLATRIAQNAAVRVHGTRLKAEKQPEQPVNAKKPHPSKYRNVKTDVDGVTFASKKEARRYLELKLLEKSGEIANLILQPEWLLTVNNKDICRYRADYQYTECRTGRTIVEDVKSSITKTRVYWIKKKLMAACYGIEILET